MKFMILIEDQDEGQFNVDVRAAAFCGPTEGRRSVTPARRVYEAVEATIEDLLGDGMTVINSPIQQKCSN